MKTLLEKLRENFSLQLFAEDGTDTDNQNGGGDNNNDSANDNPDTGTSQDAPADDKSKGKTFTQDDIDKIITNRLKREKANWEKQLEEEKEKAAMTEAERLKVEKEEAEQRSQEVVAKANAKLIKAEAKAQAVALGVKPERLNYALKLADLSEVVVDESGEPDSELIKSAIEKVIKDLPELKGIAKKIGGDTNPPLSTGDKIYTKAELNKMSQEEINKNWPKIQEQLAKGLIK